MQLREKIDNQSFILYITSIFFQLMIEKNIYDR